jgi:hypothetical protein
MFSNQLPDDDNYRVTVGAYCTRHFIKRFAKDYEGRRWDVTLNSIEQDLRRVHALQATQQVDELKRGTGCILFKYDFTVAQSGVSPKASGNRCIVFLDIETHHQTIVLLYGKADMPKKQHETIWIYEAVKDNYPALWKRLD